MIRALLFASVAMTAACIPASGIQAPTGSTLFVPTDVSIAASAGFLEPFDGLATLAILDIQVQDSENIPMENVRVEVLSNWPGVYLLPRSAVSVEDYPPEPEVDCDDPTLWDPATCPWYDTGTGLYFSLANDYGVDDPDAYRPNYIIVPTDAFGMVRAWAFIDYMPYSIDSTAADDGVLTSDEISWGEAAVSASIGVDSDVTIISVQDLGGG